MQYWVMRSFFFLIYTFLVPYTWLWILLVSFFSGFYLLVAIVYLPLLYLGTRYNISEELITFECGVIYRHKTALFRKNLIVVGLFQSPLIFCLVSRPCVAADRAESLYWDIFLKNRHLR